MKKQVIKTALLTSPIISFMVVAPVFIVKTDLKYSLLTVWSWVFTTTLLCWLLNYWLLNTNIKGSLRFIISFLTFLIVGSVINNYFKVIPPRTDLSNIQILLYRGLSLLSINLVIAILIHQILANEKQLSLNKEIADLKFAHLEAQYKLLKDQINPHFLFNALNISKSLIRKQPDDAEKYLVLLADFLRASIHYNQKSASLEKEIALFNDYIALQKVRFGDALQFSTNYKQENGSQHLPFFTLVTLAENGIKHNHFTVANPLSLNIYTENDWVIVENNKQPKVVLHSEKTGLKNINERSKILNGHDIKVLDGEKSFAVQIKLMEK